MGKLVASPLSAFTEPTFEDDLLGRQEFGDRLYNLLEHTSSGAVFALDSPWGEGKTTFVKMWKNLLHEKSVAAIYLDAFEHDHVQDPFLPLVGSLVEFAECNGVDLRSFKEKAGRVGAKLSGWALSVGVRAATLNILRNSDIEFLKGIKEEIASDAATAIETQLEEFCSDKNALEDFRNQLKTLANKLSTNSDMPLVFIVDELDRCRPTFAIALLERIKHVLDVPGIVFLLVVNRTQLEESVQCIYGNGIDASGYLGKFIHIWFSLPKNKGAGRNSDYHNYCSALYDVHDLKVWDDEKVLRKTIPDLARCFGLSLREMERLYSNIAVFYATAVEKELRLPGLSVPLAVIKMRYPDVYSELREQRASYSKVESDISELQEDDESAALWYLRKCLKGCLLSDQEINDLGEDSKVHDFRNECSQYNISRTSIIPFLCTRFDLFQAE